MTRENTNCIDSKLGYSISLFPENCNSKSGLIKNFRREFALIRSSLLYADNVKIQSIAISTLASFLILKESSAANRFSLETLDALPRVALIFTGEENAKRISNECNSLKKKEKITASDKAQTLNLVNFLVKNLQDIYDAFDFDELSSINEAEFIEINSYKNPHNYSELADDFLGSVLKAVSNPSSIPYFDQQLFSIILPIIESSGISKSTFRRKVNHADSAKHILFMLPIVQTGSTKEILNLRSELSPHIEMFRSQVFELSIQLSSNAWEPDFEHEIKEKIQFQVLPAVSKIHRKFNESSYIRFLYERLAIKPPAITAGGYLTAGVTGIIDFFSIGGGVTSDKGLVSGLAAVLAGGFSSGVALNDLLRYRKGLSQEPYYFLYAAEKHTF